MSTEKLGIAAPIHSFDEMCVNSHEQDGCMANLSFALEHNNKTVTAGVNDSILITLPENATTGFQWAVSSYTSGTVVLENVSRNPAQSTAMGAGGSQVAFQFRTTAVGNGTITLVLSRGGQGAPSDYKYTLNLNIS